MFSEFPTSVYTPARLSAGLNILVVEDDADTALSLGLLLDLEGHTVRWACDGPAALRDVRGRDWDVLLLDLGLPGANGYAVAREVRQMDLWKRPFLIATTGYGRAVDRQRSQDAGFDMHLVKPVDLEHLFKLLRRFRSVLYTSPSVGETR